MKINFLLKNQKIMSKKKLYIIQDKDYQLFFLINNNVVKILQKFLIKFVNKMKKKKMNNLMKLQCQLINSNLDQVL